ncbi:MAG: hypothetical protein KDE19_20145 [Caldilineaceae bacterium]|nr:hypothetical protein [Caldilineaceae bacterium]
MAHIELDVPDDLALRLDAVKDRLVEILESGYSSVVQEPIKLQEEVIDFLAGGPTPEEIIAFRPSQSSTERIRTLLEKNRRSSLSHQEETELDQAESLDYLMIRVKARARTHLERQSRDLPK